MSRNRPEKNTENRFTGTADPPQINHPELEAWLTELVEQAGGTDNLRSQLDQIDAESIADNAGVVPGPTPKPSGSGIGSFANAVRRDGREKTSSTKSKSSGGITKNQRRKGHEQQSLTPRALNWVNDTYEEAFFDDTNKRTVRRLINNTRGGGPHSRIACQWNDSIRGNVITEPDAIEVLQRGHKVFKNTNEFYMALLPINRQHFESVQNAHTRSTITFDDGRTRESKFAASPENSPTKASEDGCASCGKPSHNAFRCLVAPKGVVSGCPVCDCRSHNLDNCQAFIEMSIAEKVDLVVTQRGNMPAFHSSKPWYTWLHEYCSTPGFAKSQAITNFPWSKGFATKLYKEQNGNYLASVQTSFDADPLHREMLPQDPATCSYKAIWNTYWRTRQQAWPQAIGNLEDQDEDMSDARHQWQLQTMTTDINAVSTQLSDLHDELAIANSEDTAERSVADLQQQLRLLKDRVTTIEGQISAHNAQNWVVIPEGVTGDIAQMYLRLADEFRGIPCAPERCDGIDMSELAAKIAPILEDWGAKENLDQFLDAGKQNWHCLGKVLEGHPHCEIKQDVCSTHGTGCIKVRVMTLDEKVLDFGV
ncbi:hypothetical protein FAVG1_00324 [Fusarium avenaceum]|nr:hypothetical protein FAVG1_00324 [Fusarium avenaceum]